MTTGPASGADPSRLARPRLLLRSRVASRWPNAAISAAALIVVGLPLIGTAKSAWLTVLFLPLLIATVATSVLSRWLGAVVGLVSLGVLAVLPGAQTTAGWTLLLAAVPLAAGWTSVLLAGTRRPALAVLPSVFALTALVAVGTADRGQVALAASVCAALGAVQFAVLGLRQGLTPGTAAGRLSTLSAVVAVGAVAGLLAAGSGGANAWRLSVAFRELPRPDVITTDVDDPLQWAATWQLGLRDPGTLLFTVYPPVRGPLRPVWVSLQDYDGTTWRPGRDYLPLDGPPAQAVVPIDEQAAAARMLPLNLRLRVSAGLPGRWIPAPQLPLRVSSDSVPVVAEPPTGTLATTASPVGATFVVSYGSAIAATGDLRTARPSIGPGVDPALGLPAPLPPAMQELADRVSARAGTEPFARLVELARELRSTGSPATAPALSAVGMVPRSYAALDRVLQEGVGFQEQYAAVWSLVARSWGIPTQLSIGFLPKRATLAKGVFPEDASVWAAARLEGLGWVQFQPTPQDELAQRKLVIQPYDPDRPPPGPEPDPTPTPTPQPVPDPDPIVIGPSGEWFVLLVLALPVFAVAWLIAVRARRMRAVRRRSSERESAIALWWWTRALLREGGYALPLSRAVDDTVGDDVPPRIGSLVRSVAHLVAPALYSRESPAPEVVGQMRALTRDLERALTTPAVLIRRWLVPLRTAHDRRPPTSQEPPSGEAIAAPERVLSD